MRCIAHRGFAGLYPENTLTAVRQAAPQTDVIELDVRRCGSGDLVVHHDETIERMTGRDGRVADFSAAELADMDVTGSGEGIPTLESAIAAVPADVGLDLELKEPDLVTEVGDLVEGIDNEVWLSSFEVSIVKRACETTDMPVVLIVDDSAEAGIERAGGLGCMGLAPHWRLVDFALLERAHRSGLSVFPWTISKKDRARNLGKMGVDGIIADDPAVCGHF